MSWEKVRLLNHKIPESELEQIIKNRISLIEEELQVVDNQINTYRGPLDILAVDKDGTLVVMELKVVESDDMLMQAIDYYDWIRENVDTLRRMYEARKININYKKIPRIILVAPSFSESLIRRARYINIDISLYQFKQIEMAGKQGILFEQVPIPPLPYPPPTPKTRDDLLDQPQKETYRKWAKQICDRIVKISSEIEEYYTTQYIGYRFKGTLLAYLYPRKTMEPSLFINESNISIKSEQDVQKAIELVQRSFEAKGGEAKNN